LFAISALGTIENQAKCAPAYPGVAAPAAFRLPLRQGSFVQIEKHALAVKMLVAFAP
jgi:hypothetical protein